MILQKYQLAMLVVVLLCLTWNNEVQAQAKVELSPWTLGMEVATSLNTGYEYAHQAFYDRSTYGRLGGSGSYRIFRWLKLRSSVQYHRIAVTDQFYDINGLTEQSYNYHLDQHTNMLSFSIGPAIMLRVGQGDLSFGFQYGGLLDFTRVRAVRNDGELLNIDYKPAITNLQQIELGYTYWPTRQLGIGLTVGTQGIGVGAGRIVERLSPKMLVSSFEIPSEELTNLEFLHPRKDGFSFHLVLGLSFHYRLEH